MQDQWRNKGRDLEAPFGGRQFIDGKLIFESNLIVPTLFIIFTVNKFLKVLTLQFLFLETLDW